MLLGSELKLVTLDDTTPELVKEALVVFCLGENASLEPQTIDITTVLLNKVTSGIQPPAIHWNANAHDHLKRNAVASDSRANQNHRPDTSQLELVLSRSHSLRSF